MKDKVHDHEKEKAWNAFASSGAIGYYLFSKALDKKDQKR